MSTILRHVPMPFFSMVGSSKIPEFPGPAESSSSSSTPARPKKGCDAQIRGLETLQRGSVPKAKYTILQVWEELSQLQNKVLRVQVLYKVHRQTDFRLFLGTLGEKHPGCLPSWPHTHA